MKPLHLTLLAAPLLAGLLPAAPALDADKLLTTEDFWLNKDFDWYKNSIPIFDCPDKEILTTYYYRWELVTRHLVYGNPNTGYAFTEFANRPGWSGAYGTIACPAGLQINDVRWLHNPRFVRDYLRFWMRHPGAQPRNYSFWAADSTWSAYLVQPNNDFVTDLLPDLIHNFEEWEKRGWVEDMDMFWQLGHDDGMEFDINAQQTKDILRGGQSLRPSFNAYMWADANALASIAKLDGERATASKFTKKAERIKASVQKNLWDPSRLFFFPMSNQEHEKDGHVVKKHTLTYETGQFAGSIHGRELHGYVPWAFNMPDPGFEDAWQFLMNEEFFKSKFGPTTVEQKDPLFALKGGCCWWSGQSWPFATAQTLKAMANVLQNYQQKHVDRNDYAELLHTFSVSQRKDGKPYIAEALNPFNGSWKGHDMANRSEHYFHSGFTDLVITGLVGMQPSAGEKLTIHPLAPDDWDYFAMDNIAYHGHMISVIWDRDGTRYNSGKGFQILVDGKRLATSRTPGKTTVQLPSTKVIPYDDNPPMNYAVNNDGDYYPRYQASFVNPRSSLATISDGLYVYDIKPANRWTAVDSPNEKDWLEVDFGTERPIDTVKMYVIDDGEGGEVRAPAKIQLGYWDGSKWNNVPNQKASSDIPLGGRPYTITFPVLKTSRLRAFIDHADDTRAGLTEFEAWGPGTKPYVPASPSEGNLAYNPKGEGFPKITASHSDRFGGVPKRAIDGRIIYSSKPVNRWTSFGSTDETDWLELEFSEKESFSRVILHIFDDKRGVRAPKAYQLEGWNGKEWLPIPDQIKKPATPIGSMANTVTFKPVSLDKLRVVFTHDGRARSGLTELEVWEK